MTKKIFITVTLLFSLSVFAQTRVSTFTGVTKPSAYYLSNHQYHNSDNPQGATFNFPWANASGPDGSIYVIEKQSNFIRKVTPAGYVSLYAGSDSYTETPYPHYNGYGLVNGTLLNARFSSIMGIACSASGNIYVADFGNKAIRKISGNNVTTLAVGFNSPNAVCVDSNENVYVVDGTTVKKVTPLGVVTVISGSTAGNVNGNLTLSKYRNLEFIALDEANNIIYVSDTDNSNLRKLDLNANSVTTVSFTADGFTLSRPSGLAFKNGLQIADSGNNMIFKYSTSGVATRLAGNGRTIFKDGLATLSFGATFVEPKGICINPLGETIVMDYGNNIIRKIKP